MRRARAPRPRTASRSRRDRGPSRPFARHRRGALPGLPRRRPCRTSPRARDDAPLEHRRRNLEPDDQRRMPRGARPEAVLAGTSDSPASASSSARTTRRRSFAWTAVGRARVEAREPVVRRRPGRARPRRSMRSRTPRRRRRHARGRRARRGGRGPCRHTRPRSRCGRRARRSRHARALAYAPTDISSSRSRIPTSVVGRAGWFVRTASPR